MKVTDIADGESEDESVISETAGSSTVGMILDISLEKTVTIGESAASTNVYELNNLIEVSIILPEELQGKNSYSIVRMHNGTPDTITTKANEYDEYLVVNSDKTMITAYICRFSTYAIAFTEKTSSSGSSSSSLDTSAPTIVVDGETITVSDANLKSITINGVEIEISASEMELDLSIYGNGEYEVVATDKYGRETTQTVVVSSVSDQTVSPTEKPETPEVTETPTTPTPQPEDNESNNWWWIILVVIAVGVCGYVVYKKKDRK